MSELIPVWREPSSIVAVAYGGPSRRYGYMVSLSWRADKRICRVALAMQLEVFFYSPSQGDFA